MRAAIYLRISQDATGEALGVTRQLEDCKKAADVAGWDVIEVYTDNDISATTGRPRPAYRQMLRAIEAGEIQAIIAWAPDRLYRKLSDLEELIPLVEAHGTAIRTCRAGDFDLGTPLGKMIARILGAVATGEGDVKVDRWKRSVRQRREAGAFPHSGPRMYGWTRDGEVVEAEAIVTRWMADEIAGGRAVNSLVRELEDRGIPTSTGGVWLQQSLKVFLTNPRLAGYATLKGEIVGTGQWEPILTPEQWETVRAALQARKGTAKSRTRVALLPGLIFCGGCGAPMVTGARMTKRKETQRVYRCTREAGRGGCQKVSGRADLIEEIVESAVQTALSDPRVRERVESLRSGGSSAAETEMGELEMRRQELEHQLDQPGVPVATILRALDRTKERQEALLRALAGQSRVPLPSAQADWPSDLRRRRALVDLVVARVEIAPATKPGLFDPERVIITER